MSDDSRAYNIYVPDTNRGDPVYQSRQLLDSLLQVLPTEKEIAARTNYFSRMTAPAFALPGMPKWINDLFTSAHETVCTAASSSLTMATHPFSRETMHQAMMSNSVITHWLSSRDAAHWMWNLGDPKGEPDKITEYNDALYTHSEDGKLHRVVSDDIVKHFQGPPETWPAQVVLTANHARTQGSDDISEIMQNVSALLRHALPDGTLQLERHPHSAENVAGKTIMVSAVHAEDSSLRNGADLLFRNIYLREHKSLAERICPNSKPGLTVSDIPVPYYMEGYSHTQKTAAQQVEFEHRGPSPAAIRLAKLMLKAMAEEPSRIDVDEMRTLAEQESDLQTPHAPLVLRADAAQIARHITLVGYSKAANTVNDAIRYLQYELSSQNEQGMPMMAQRQSDGAIQDLQSPAGVRDIVKHIGIIGINGPGVPLTQEEKDLGTYRLRINNSNDMISGHFLRTDRSHITQGVHDLIYMVKGNGKGLGHEPNDALGIKTATGYIHDDPKAMELIGKVLYRKYGLQEPTPESWLEKIRSRNSGQGHGGPSRP